MSRLKKILVAAAGLYALVLAIVLGLRVLFGDAFWWLSLLNTFTHLLFAPLVIVLPLVLLLRARFMAVRMLPLLLIGGLWYAPYYLAKSPAQPSGTTLHVLTANVWGNNHDLNNIQVWLRRVQADVVLLQEISPAYAEGALPGLLDLYPHQFSQPDDTRWGGNIILSRYPVVSADFADLGKVEYPNPIRVVIQVNDQQIAIYNVHLAFPIETPRLPFSLGSRYVQYVFGYNDRERNDQIDRLLKLLEDEPLPFIVGGDFNTSDQTPTYSRLAEQMTDSYREVGRGFGGSWPVVAARGGLPGFVPPLVRIDYIWHSDGLEAVNAWRGEFIGSDHMPMHAVLALRTE